MLLKWHVRTAQGQSCVLQLRCAVPQGHKEYIQLFPHIHINPSRSIWACTGLNVGAGWDLLHPCSRDAPSSQEDVGSRMWAASTGRRSLFITPIPDETLVLIQGLHVMDGFFPPRRDFHCLGVSCSSFTHGQPEADNGMQGLEENMWEQRKTIT